MTAKIADRVRETSTTTGTGTLTLAGAATGYQTFSAAFSNGDLVPYCVVDTSTGAWEVGQGTYSAGTLARTVVIASSNADAAVSFTVGTRDVFCAPLADFIAYGSARHHMASSTSDIPTVTDDSSKGYVANQSLWDFGSGLRMVCTSAAVGAATWELRVPVRYIAGGASSTKFRYIGGTITSAGLTGSNQNISLTDASSAFSTEFGTPSFSAILSGYSLEMAWWGAIGMGMGIATGNSFCQAVDATTPGVTSDATPTFLYPEDDEDSGWFMVPNTAIDFEIRVLAKKADGSEARSWRITGLVLRGAAGSPAIVGTPTIADIAQTAGASTWDVDVAAGAFGSGTGEGLQLQVTGAAATTIVWAAKIDSVQILY